MNPASARSTGIGKACGHEVNVASRSSYVDILDESEVLVKVFDGGR